MRFLKRPSHLGPYNEDQTGDWLCAHEDCNATGFCFDIWPINHPNPPLSHNTNEFGPDTFVDFGDVKFDDDDELDSDLDEEDQLETPETLESNDPNKAFADFLELLQSHARAEPTDASDTDPLHHAADHADASHPNDAFKQSSKHIWLDINTDIASAHDAGPKGNTEQPDLRNPKHDGDIPF
jgi:hypothetical protein